MRDFRKLRVLNVAHEHVLDMYRVTDRFPEREKYGLTAQMRRAGASIGANICEGCGKSEEADFVRYLSIAAGSASELRYQFLLSRDLGYLNLEEYERLDAAINDVMKMLNGLMRAAKSRLPSKTRNHQSRGASTRVSEPVAQREEQTGDYLE